MDPFICSFVLSLATSHNIKSVNYTVNSKIYSRNAKIFLDNVKNSCLPFSAKIYSRNAKILVDFIRALCNNIYVLERGNIMNGNDVGFDCLFDSCTLENFDSMCQELGTDMRTLLLCISMYFSSDYSSDYGEMNTHRLEFFNYFDSVHGDLGD